MDSEEKQLTANEQTKLGGHDEIDFTSGFETQYRKEYSPLRPKYDFPPPDKRNAWYRSPSTVLMVAFLAAVFLLGTVMLVTMVFTSSPMQIFFIVIIYVAIAVVMIWLEVNSIKVR